MCRSFNYSCAWVTKTFVCRDKQEKTWKASFILSWNTGNIKIQTDELINSNFFFKKHKNTHTKSSLSLISVNHSLKGALKLNEFFP